MTEKEIIEWLESNCYLLENGFYVDIDRKTKIAFSYKEMWASSGNIKIVVKLKDLQEVFLPQGKYSVSHLVSDGFSLKGSNVVRTKI